MAGTRESTKADADGRAEAPAVTLTDDGRPIERCADHPPDPEAAAVFKRSKPLLVGMTPIRAADA